MKNVDTSPILTFFLSKQQTPTGAHTSIMIQKIDQPGSTNRSIARIYYRVSQKKRPLKFKTRNVFHRELTLGNERKCLW